MITMQWYELILLVITALLYGFVGGLFLMDWDTVKGAIKQGFSKS